MSKSTASSEERDELLRLQTLLEYEILDTPPEIEYDDVTYIASLICDVPFAVITLVAEDRAWFKSRIGIDIPSVPREMVFCNHTILQKNLLEVGDLRADPRFAANPMVVGGPQFIFYAGAPIITPNGTRAGTVCVLDQQPRHLSDAQKKSLEALARQVAGQLETRKLNGRLRSQLQQIQDSTRKIATQEQSLIFTAKMTALGEMASGVAHEINNPLAIIMGYNEIISDWADKNKLEAARVKELCERIDFTGARVAKTIASLRAFTKDGSHDPFQPALVKEILDQTLDFCRTRFKNHRIALQVSSYREDLELECQKNQIGHVLLNLLNNSYDAVEGNPEKWVRIDVLETEDSVSFVVTDSGLGIPHELCPHIMKPFFSAKKGGKGAGLGLSVALGVAETHGGSLTLDMQSVNTRFVVSFPKKHAASQKNSTRLAV